jgi:hypothetical protein
MIDLRLALPDQDIVGDNPVFIKCREHNDTKKPNLAVYADGLKCFACGFYMELRDKAGNDTSLLPGHRDPLAYLLGVEEVSPEVRSKYTVESIDRYRTRAAEEASRDPLPKSLAAIYNGILNGELRKHRLQWFLDRGLTLETINHPDILLGHNGIHFVIPVFDRFQNLVSLRYRMDPEYSSESKHKYLGMKGRNGLYLYPEPLLTQSLDYLYICEGELDAIRMWQQGLPTVTVTNGAGQVEKIPAILKEHYPNIKKLILATDQDDAGNEAAIRTAEAGVKLGFECERLHWEGGKDITEHLLVAA